MKQNAIFGLAVCGALVLGWGLGSALGMPFAGAGGLEEKGGRSGEAGPPSPTIARPPVSADQRAARRPEALSIAPNSDPGAIIREREPRRRDSRGIGTAAPSERARPGGGATFRVALFGRDGERLSRRDVTVHAVHQQDGWVTDEVHRLATDAEGRLVWTVKNDGGRSAQQVAFEVRCGGAENGMIGAFRRVPEAQWRAGGDLEPMTLCPLPTLARGRVEEEDGMPVSGATVTLSPAADGEEDLTRLHPSLAMRTDEAGRFRFVGSFRETHYRISVDAGHPLKRLARDVEARRGDLLFAFRRGRCLVAEIIPPAQASAHLDVTLTRGSPALPYPVEVTRDGDGHLLCEARHLPAGTYELAVWTPSRPDPVARIAGLRISEGEHRPAALNPLDLRAEWRRTRIAVSAAGATWPVVATLKAPDEPNLSFPRVPYESGLHEVLRPVGSSTRLQVGLPHHRTQTVPLRDTSLSVELRPGLRVAGEVTGLPEALPGGVALWLEAGDPQLPEIAHSHQVRGNGNVWLKLGGPGRYAFTWRVSRSREGAAPLRATVPAGEITLGEADDRRRLALPAPAAVLSTLSTSR